jgi:hypothetical protein
MGGAGLRHRKPSSLIEVAEKLPDGIRRRNVFAFQQVTSGRAASADWSQAFYGSRSSVRYSGASAFDLVMKAAWASSSSAGGGSVRDVTG